MEIGLKDIGKLLKKSWAVLLVCILASTIIGAGASIWLMEREYTASSMVMVGSTTLDENGKTQNMTYNDYNLNVKLVNSYRVLCKSHRVLNPVIEKLGLNMNTADLGEMISVTSESDTEIIRISATSTSPQFAMDVTNTLVDVFKEEVSNIMKMDNVQVIDYAILPTEPVSPNIPLNTAVSFLAGLLIGFVIAVLRYVTDDTVKDPESVTDVLDIPVIGSIPKIV